MRAVVFCAVAGTILSGCGSGGSDNSPPQNNNTPPPTFSLSGTVSGLSSSGLALTVNGTKVLVQSGATTIALASTVPSGTAYSVAVATQPTGATCTVTGGTGTISANVNNVAVSCSANTYAVGGSITGLKTSGLVLLNGTDATTIAANATQFAMTNKVTYGGNYTITVQTQPTGATCTLSSGTGTVAAADVSNVAVSCSQNSYTISGTVTGLTLGGLVLVNGTDSKPIPANATQFTMTNKVSYGGNYTITVGTQPLPRYCSVANGSGSSVSSDVTNVTINCTPPIVYSFNGTPDTSTPTGRLLEASDGNFYGTSMYGGAHGKGTVFKITPAGTETVLYSFTGGVSDGGNPLRVSLVEGNDGNFYGTASTGGANGKGTVFKITPVGVLTNLHSFAGAPTDGNYPLAGLQQGSDGNFYGTTFIGGANDVGAVFKISPSGVESTLYSFATGGDANNPASPLIEARDGNFYGYSSRGGVSNRGAVFQLTPAGVETVLHSFLGPPGDGAFPEGGALLEGSDGNFYGTAPDGGTNDRGIVFRLTPAGVHTVLYSFSGSDGDSPIGGLVRDSDGTLYGATYFGGTSGAGTVFKLSSTGTLTQLYSFNGDGANPESGLIRGSDGNLYGTTNAGGSMGQGTFFRIAPP